MSQPRESVVIYLNGGEMQLENIFVVMQSEINEHVTTCVTAMIKANIYDEYIRFIKRSTALTIVHKIQETEAFRFEGFITDVDIELNGGSVENSVYYINIKAKSHTYALDIKKENCSFQDNQMTYDAMIKQLLAEFAGADFINNVAKGTSLTVFVLQYRDTVWEFLLREAGKFEQGIFPDATFASPKFQFGLPAGIDRGNLEEYEYTVSKSLDCYNALNDNEYEHGLESVDLIEYTIRDRYATKTFMLGDAVSYQKIKLYISKVYSEIQDNKLYNTYTLTTKNGLKMPRLANGNLQGLALPGKIIEVKGNKAKIHLEVDEMQDVDTATWFDYATWHATWYCMPEVGDYAYLYFPNELEYHAFILNSMKQDPNAGYDRNNAIPMRPEYAYGSTNGMTESPIVAATGAPTTVSPVDFVPMANNNRIKMLTTKDGKTISLGEDLIIIDNNQGSFIELHDGGGITVYTVSDLRLYAEKDIEINCKETLKLQAEESIRLDCDGSVIEITPEKITLKGKDIDMN